MHTVNYGVDTVHAPYRDGASTGQGPCEHRPKTIIGEPMMGQILVRMRIEMTDAIRTRAEAGGQTAAAWARQRLARAVGRPSPKSRRQAIPPASELHRDLVRAHELIAAVGLELIAASSAPGPDGRHTLPTMDKMIRALRSASSTLTRVIEASR